LAAAVQPGTSAPVVLTGVTSRCRVRSGAGAGRAGGVVVDPPAGALPGGGVLAGSVGLGSVGGAPVGPAAVPAVLPGVPVPPAAPAGAVGGAGAAGVAVLVHPAAAATAIPATMIFTAVRIVMPEQMPTGPAGMTAVHTVPERPPAGPTGGVAGVGGRRRQGRCWRRPHSGGNSGRASG
jgi:hypothetical protein